MRSKISWLLLLLSVAVGGSFATAATTGTACAVELFPTGDELGVNDLLNFRTAVNNLNDGDCVYFNPGEYFYDMGYYNSDDPTTEPSPDCNGGWDCKASVMFLYGKSNIAIKGPVADENDESTSTARAILQFVNYDKSRGDQYKSSMIQVSECNNVTISDLKIRMRAPTDLNHVLAEVVNVQTDHTLRIKVPVEHLPLVPASYDDIEGNPITNPSACDSISGIQDDAFFAEHFMRLDSQKQATGWEHFASGDSTGLKYDAWLDPDQGECGTGNECQMVLVQFFYSSSTSCRSLNTGIYSNFNVGDYLLIMHQKRATNGVRFYATESLTLTRLTFHNLAGPSVAGSLVRNLQVYDLVAEAPVSSGVPVGWRTVNDVMWVRGYGGSNNIIDGMRLENLSDDYFNFHTGATRLEPATISQNLMLSGEGTCIQVATSWWWEVEGGQYGTQVAEVGDIILIYDDTQALIWKGEFLGRKTYNSVQVACFRPNTNDAQPLAQIFATAKSAASARWMPDEQVDPDIYSLTIRNVQVLNSRARGLIRGSHTLLEDITVRHNMMAGVYIASDPSGAESAPASHVTIRNSEFDNVSINKRGHVAAIFVGSKRYSSGSGLDALIVNNEPKRHENIVIENVMIRNQPQAAIFAAGVENLVMRNLTLDNINTESYDQWNQYNRESLATTLPTPFIVPGSVPVYLFGTTTGTSGPTNLPTPGPTEIPSSGPSLVPTSGPTDAPVTQPTKAPNVAPTFGPTISLTDAPVMTPTEAPNAAPTIGPTSSPTDAPVATPTEAPNVAPTIRPTTSPTGSPTIGTDNQFCQALALEQDNHCGTEKDGEPKIMMCYYDGKRQRNRSKCESPSDIEEKYQDPKKLLLHCGCCVIPDEIAAKDQNKDCPAPATRRLNLRTRGD